MCALGNLINKFLRKDLFPKVNAFIKPTMKQYDPIKIGYKISDNYKVCLTDKVGGGRRLLATQAAGEAIITSPATMPAAPKQAIAPNTNAASSSKGKRQQPRATATRVNANTMQLHFEDATEMEAAITQLGYGKSLKKGFKRIGKGLKKGFKKIGKGFRKFGKAMKGGFKRMGKAFKKFGQKVGRGISKAGKMVLYVQAKLVKYAKKGAQFGRHVVMKGGKFVAGVARKVAKVAHKVAKVAIRGVRAIAKATIMAVKYVKQMAKMVINTIDMALKFLDNFMCAGGSYSFNIKDITGLSNFGIDPSSGIKTCYASKTDGSLVVCEGSFKIGVRSIKLNGSFEANAHALGMKMPFPHRFHAELGPFHFNIPFKVTAKTCSTPSLHMEPKSTVDISTIQMKMQGVPPEMNAVFSAGLTMVVYQHVAAEIQKDMAGQLTSTANGKLPSTVRKVPWYACKV